MARRGHCTLIVFLKPNRLIFLELMLEHKEKEMSKMYNVSMVICTDYILNLHFFFFPSISEHFGPNTKSQNVTWSACLLLIQPPVITVIVGFS